MRTATANQVTADFHVPRDTDRGCVLIADDVPISLRTINELVQRCGYRTQPVADGFAALAALSDDVAVALLDLRMPGMDGLKCLRQARDRFPDLKVVIISGSHEFADAVAALRSGAFDYLTKPITIDELWTRLRQAMQAHRLSRANRALSSENGERHVLPTCPLAGHTLRQLERAAILDTLAACGGNKARAARELGMSEKSIYNKIRRLEISAADIEGAPTNFGRHLA